MENIFKYHTKCLQTPSAGIIRIRLRVEVDDFLSARLRAPLFQFYLLTITRFETAFNNRISFFAIYFEYHKTLNDLLTFYNIQISV